MCCGGASAAVRVVEGVDGDHDVGEGRDEDEVPWHERSEESRGKNQCDGLPFQ